MDVPEPPSDSAGDQPTGDLTQLLRAWRAGDPAALDRLLPEVYGELRRLAVGRLRQGRGGNTLQPTALVHEAFLRLLGGEVDWQNRAHFFAVASRAMRAVAVDHYRAQTAEKRGGDAVRVDLSGVVDALVEPRNVDLMALDGALTRLEAMSAVQARVVELRYFAGLSLEEVAEVTGRSRASVHRDWRAARAWLFTQLSGDG